LQFLGDGGANIRRFVANRRRHCRGAEPAQPACRELAEPFFRLLQLLQQNLPRRFAAKNSQTDERIVPDARFGVGQLRFQT